MPKEHINPDTLFLFVPHGFSQVIATHGGKTIYISGQTAWDAEKRLVGGNSLEAQAKQALQNVRHAVETAGGSLADVVALTLCGGLQTMMPTAGGVPEFFPGVHPPTILVGVSSLSQIFTRLRLCRGMSFVCAGNECERAETSSRTRRDFAIGCRGIDTQALLGGKVSARPQIAARATEATSSLATTDRRVAVSLHPEPGSHEFKLLLAPGIQVGRELKSGSQSCWSCCTIRRQWIRARKPLKRWIAASMSKGHRHHSRHPVPGLCDPKVPAGPAISPARPRRILFVGQRKIVDLKPFIQRRTKRRTTAGISVPRTWLVRATPIVIDMFYWREAAALNDDPADWRERPTDITPEDWAFNQRPAKTNSPGPDYLLRRHHPVRIGTTFAPWIILSPGRRTRNARLRHCQ